MGLTKPRASQIFDIDYKQATRVITVSDVTLAGGAPSQVDGVNLAEDDRVLVTGQNTASQNGLYFVSSVGTGANGTWLRTTDGNENGEVQAGMIVMVTEGTVYQDTQWKLTTDDPIVIGTTPLTFAINILSQIGGANTQIQYNNAGTMGGSANLTWNGTTLYTNGAVSATGNVTGNYFIGDGSQLTGISGGGSTAASALTGNTLSSNVINSSLTSVGTLGSLSVTGNITGGNILGGANVNATIHTGTTVSVTGNINGGNLISAALVQGVTVSASGNVIGGNVTTAGLISATGNVTGAAITGTSLTVSTGNITAGNLLLSGAIVDSAQLDIQTSASNANIVFTPNGTGNVNTGANVSVTGAITGGSISTVGNIVGNNISTSTAFVTKTILETVTVNASAFASPSNYDILTQSVWYSTASASANFTLNIRGNSSVTANTLLSVGQSMTFALMVTNGATPYYPNAFQVDTVSVTPIYQGGTAFSSGNANSTDVYSFTLIKTAATPTYKLLASQTKFA
jgi:hypothetical protein